MQPVVAEDPALIIAAGTLPNSGVLAAAPGPLTATLSVDARGDMEAVMKLASATSEVAPSSIEEMMRMMQARIEVLESALKDQKIDVPIKIETALLHDKMVAPAATGTAAPAAFSSAGILPVP